MQNYKKHTYYFLVLSIIFVGILPLINFNTFIKYNDTKKLFNIDVIEQYIHYGIYKFFDKSYQPKKVIVGKDGMLFLGNEYKHILYKIQGLYKSKNYHNAIDNWTDKLKNLEEWYKTKGIKFVLIVVPNKHTVHKEKLPNWSSINKKTMVEDVIDIAHSKKLHLLNLKSAFMELNSTTQHYLNTDTHWNNSGAALGFKKTIQFINTQYGLNYNIPNYRLKKRTHEAGDLARLLKIKYLLPKDHENNFRYEFEKKQKICHGYFSQKNQIKECTMKNNLIMDVNKKAQYMINKSALNDVKLLLLCDSFGAANSKLYNRTFSTIWKFHYNHLYGEALKSFVKKNQPDIVIYQVVERKLFEQNIVKSMDKITLIPEGTSVLSKAKIFDIYHNDNTYYRNNQFSIKSHILTVKGTDPMIILDTLKSHAKKIMLTYKIESKHDTKFQIFYKNNKEDTYHQKDSYTVSLKEGLNTINLFIPTKFINNAIRVDFVNSLGSYKLHEFSIVENLE